MIEIITPINRSAYQDILSDMFRLRYDVLVKQWNWHLPEAKNNQDIDQFDTHDTVYIVRLSDARDRVLGCCRINPTTNRHMMQELFADACNLQPAPIAKDIAETSRFAVCPELSRSAYYKVLWEVLIGINEYCLVSGIKRISWFTNKAFYSALLRVFKAEPLGLPQYYKSDNDSYIPAVADVNVDTLRATRKHLKDAAQHVTYALMPITSQQLELQAQTIDQEAA